MFKGTQTIEWDEIDSTAEWYCRSENGQSSRTDKASSHVLVLDGVSGISGNSSESLATLGCFPYFSNYRNEGKNEITRQPANHV